MRYQIVIPGVVLALFGLAGLAYWLPESIGTIDLAQYWAASRLFWDGSNPYDPALVLQLQQPILNVPEPIRMWNPPTIFPIVFWFGWLEFHLLHRLWFFLSLLLVVWCYARARVSLLRSGDRRLPTLYLVTFFPIVDMLSWGQISSVLLVGLTFFLFPARQRERSSGAWLRGAALALTSLKPHLLFLVYCWLALGCLTARRWRECVGCIVGTALLAGAAWTVQPEIFAWYFEATTTPPLEFKTPTLGFWLYALQTEVRLLRFLPALIAVLALLVWAAVNRKTLASESFLFLLIPASLLCSPYGWGYDQLLLLPVGLWLISSQGSAKGARRMAGLLIAANVGLILTPPEWGQQYAVWFPAVYLAFAWRVLSSKK